jgi:eukaryotic-like serine/threonine-protein kinase
MSTTATTPQDFSRDNAMPTLIGKYRVLRRLGEGATSEVFLCHDDFLGRDVAIKRVRATAVGDPIDGRYFERFFAAEAALVGQLKHPNVVQIFDAVPDPIEPYLVMEYVAGSTLPKSLIFTSVMVPLLSTASRLAGFTSRWIRPWR